MTTLTDRFERPRRRRISPAPGLAGLPLTSPAVLLPLLLAGYLFGDRGFAWLHVPKTPLFVGELVLVTALLGRYRVPIRQALSLMWQQPAGQALLVFVSYSMVRTLPGLAQYRIPALRDAALWYYAAVGVLVFYLVAMSPALISSWIEAYERLVPWFLAWVPLALYLRAALLSGPFIPDSSVPLVAYKPGNLAVHIGIALAFLWAISRQGGSRRVLLLAAGLVMLLAVATQNRAGMLSGALAFGFTIALGMRNRAILTRVTAAVLIPVVAAATLGVEIRLTDRRTVSVHQLVLNVQSLTLDESSGGGQLQRTVEWRQDLWMSVIDDTTVTAQSLLVGQGFGTNLAGEHVSTQAAEKENPLRNPHNSHLTVFARLGFIGAALWILLWFVWFRQLLLARRYKHATGHPRTARFLTWVMAGAVAILVNAIFDPSLESPPVGFWIWALYGLGAAASHPLWTLEARPESGSAMLGLT